MIACRFLGFRIVSPQQIFKHLTQQLGVECHLLFFWRVLFDGEVVATENRKESSFWFKEKDVRHYGTMLEATIGKTCIVAAKTIKIVALFHSVNVARLVETLKQSTIQKWNFRKGVNDLLFAYGKHFGIAIQGLDIALARSGKFSSTSIFFYDGTVEGAKK